MNPILNLAIVSIPVEGAHGNSEPPSKGHSVPCHFSRSHDLVRNTPAKGGYKEGVNAFRAPVDKVGDAVSLKYIPNPQVKRLTIDEKYMQKGPVEGLADVSLKGKIKGGDQWAHSPESMSRVVANAVVMLPSGAAEKPAEVKFKDLKDLPPNLPVVIIMHGSGGLGAATNSLQGYLAAQGIVSIAPNSFELAGRVTYQSPIDKSDYEKIHEMRASELNAVYKALEEKGGNHQIILIGTSEGSVSVSRAELPAAAKVICSYSAEPGYFTQQPKNNFPQGQPVLNMISSTDPFFTTHNPFLGNSKARGDAADQLKEGDARNSVVLVDRAPHTLINIPEVQQMIVRFINATCSPDSTS